MPDFTAPGSEGTLPPGHNEFLYGLIYTVHPRVLRPLVAGEEYRLVVCTRQKVGRERNSFAPLYRRAMSLARARAADLTCEQPDIRPHTWTAAHAWFEMEIPGAAMVGAVVTLGIMCSAAGALPHGEPEPTLDDLARPSVAGVTANGPDRDVRRWDELYNEFDVRHEPSATGSIVTFSYGEYASTCEAIDYAAYVDRAERCARRCYEAPTAGSSAPLPLVRRDWTCIRTDKASRQCLVHVNIYLQT
jgi:hypothetical protein